MVGAYLYSEYALEYFAHEIWGNLINNVSRSWITKWEWFEGILSTFRKILCDQQWFCSSNFHNTLMAKDQILIVNSLEVFALYTSSHLFGLLHMHQPGWTCSLHATFSSNPLESTKNTWNENTPCFFIKQGFPYKHSRLNPFIK